MYSCRSSSLFQGLRNLYPELGYSYEPLLAFLPSDNLIYNFLLLQAASSQIDTCCLYAFVSHQVGKQGHIVELLQEILGFLQDFR